MPATVTCSLSGNSYIDGLLGDRKWASSELTFSFPESAPVFGASYGYGEPTYNFAPLSVAQQAAVRSALNNYAAVAQTVDGLRASQKAVEHDDGFVRIAGI